MRKLDINTSGTHVPIHSSIHTTNRNRQHALGIHTGNAIRRRDTHHIALEAMMMATDLLLELLQMLGRELAVANLDELDAELVSGKAAVDQLRHVVLDGLVQELLVLSLAVGDDDEVERQEEAVVSQRGYVGVEDVVDARTRGGAVVRGVRVEG
jgi:hypothetical protein